MSTSTSRKPITQTLFRKQPIESHHNSTHVTSQPHFSTLKSLPHNRHQPSLIPSNPDAPPPDISLLETQLPKWCQTALMQGSSSSRHSAADSAMKSPLKISGSTSSSIQGTHNKARIHACRALVKVAEERPDLRKAMILSRGLVETITMVLNEEEDEKNALALRRCQQLFLDLLSMLTLTDPILDQYIVHEEGMTDALAKMLLSSDRDLQESVSIVFDYFCVCEENRSIVCSTDHMLFGVVQLLHNTKSVDAREHVLQGLLYLSESPENNQFLIPRQPGMLEALTLCLFYLQISIPTKTLQILHNLLLLKENIPLVARHKELRERIQITMRNAKKALHRNGQLELTREHDEDLLNEIEQEAGHQDESPLFHAPPSHYDNLMPSGSKARQQMVESGTKGVDPFRFEKEIVRISTIILQLLFRYDTRLNSKVILDGSDFTSQPHIIVPHSEGDFISSSIVLSEGNQVNQSTASSSMMVRSFDEMIHARRNNIRRMALERKEEEMKAIRG